MTGDAHIVITVVVGICSFVLGFFLNLLAMRSMFVGTKDFEAFKSASDDRCASKREACEPILSGMADLKKDISDLFVLMRENHGKIERLVGQLESRR